MSLARRRNGPGRVAPPAVQVGTNAAVDAVTAEVVGALRAAGARGILLRGPAISSWLYRAAVEAIRAYDDIDLLVSVNAVDRASAVLERLGFSNRSAALAPGESVEHSTEWHRPGSPVPVDLHRSLLGVKAEPPEPWETLASDTLTLSVAGCGVEVPSIPARAMVVVLHSAAHGRDHAKPLRDLDRALEQAEPGLWTDAAAVAARLGATPAFSAGLQLLPAGCPVAERLGIADAPDTEAALLASSPPPTAYGFARLAATTGLFTKLSFLARKLVPSPAFIRHAFPIARRGPLGHLLGYLWRPIWLLSHAGPGLIAWLRARR